VASSESAAGYLLQASTAANFYGTVYSSSTYDTDLSTLTVSLGLGGVYYLRVGSLNSLNAANFVLVGSTSTLPPPTLLSPGDGLPVSTSAPVMTWNPKTIGNHRLQLSLDSGFTQVIADSTTANAFYVSTNTLSHAVTYWWRVAPTPGGQWSAVFNFKPDLSAPIYSVPEVSTDAATGPWTSLPMVTYLSSTAATVRLTVQDPDAGLLTSTGLPAGLVGQWHFDESSGTIALDASTNTIIGNLIGGPLRVSGPRGGAVSFNGNQYVSLGNSQPLHITGSLTTEAWVKYNDLAGCGAVFSGKLRDLVWCLFWCDHDSIVQ